MHDCLCRPSFIGRNDWQTGGHPFHDDLPERLWCNGGMHQQITALHQALNVIHVT
ncbi:hypothetical protein D1872_345030 [compost metagenome]